MLSGEPPVIKLGLPLVNTTRFWPKVASATGCALLGKIS